MTLTIHVLNAGLLTTVQGLGRNGYRRFGLPAAGAMDAYALAAANLLVGNPLSTAALECTLLGPTLRFGGHGVIALTGADLGATLNEVPLAPWQSVSVKDQDQLAFVGRQTGCRAYLSVQGGLDLPVVMGDQSTYIRGAVGGLSGRALKKGDLLAGGPRPNSSGDWIGALPLLWHPVYRETMEARVVLGPQDDFFSHETLEIFLDGEYEVSKEADRMGYRLLGPTIMHLDRKEIASDGVLPGAIQIPGHGQPIVLLADAQTAGGYPKIASVIGPDLAVFAQALPGTRIRFRRVSLDEAVTAQREVATALTDMARWLAEQHSIATTRLLVTVNGQEFEVQVRER